MTIRGSGIVTGLDTRSLINQLLSVERQPISKLEARQREYRREISDLGSLSSRLSDFTRLLDDMGSADDVLASTASSSNPEAVDVEASGRVARGNFQVEVTELAQTAKFRSAAFASGSDTVQAGTLTIEVWGEDAVDITIDQGATLADVREQVERSGAQVSASIVRTGSEAYLTISSLKSGHEIGGSPAGALVLSQTPDGAGGGSALGLAQTQAAVNAQFSIDGLGVERSENRVSDAVDGVTFELKQRTSSPLEIEVSTDFEESANKAKAFVDQYNGLLRDLDRATDKNFARRVRNELQRSLSDSGGSGQFASLGSVGITTDPKSGELVFNEQTYSDALETNAQAVVALWSGDGGVQKTFSAALERYTDSIDGSIKLTQDSKRRQIDQLDLQIESRNRRLEAYEESLVRQFSVLEQLTNELNSISGSFAGLLPF